MVLQSELLIEIPVSVSMHKGKPSILLKRFSSDPEINKALIYATLTNKPITFQLVFRKPHIQIRNLIDKGIMYRDEKKELRFTKF